MIHYVDETEIKNKKVIVRCDFNVPIQDGKIIDNSRIIKSLETINLLLKNNNALILMSHLGRIKTAEDKEKYSLQVVRNELSRLLNKDVKFLNSPVGMETMKVCKELKNGEVVLLENTRYCDLTERLESNNDLNLAKYWASLADVFVVDAFGSLHRNHASVAGISTYLPTYIGLLVKEEINNLNPVIMNIKRPFTIFMGGAKVDDKLGYIKLLLKKCDKLLLGGGIANSFLYACGYDVKDSLCTTDEMTLDEIRELIKVYKDKIIMPIDFVIEDNKILDLGDRTINKYKKYLDESKTIFINGTCGKFEESRFSHGTIALFSTLKNNSAIKIAGGGDTLNAINEFGLQDAFTFLSSGGGASLEYISNNNLAALDYINKHTDTNRQ